METCIETKIKANMAESALASNQTRPLESFPAAVLNCLKACSLEDAQSLENIRILGSGARRAIPTSSASDVDGFCTVRCPYASRRKCAKWLAKRLQKAVKRLMELENVHISDCKAGVDLSARVLPFNAYLSKGKKVKNYDMNAALQKLAQMASEGLISDAQLHEALELVHKCGESPSPDQWFELLAAFHEWSTVRWSPRDIAAGRVELLGDRFLSLEDAWLLPAIVKIDLVAWIGNKASDISLIFQGVTSTGKPVNPFAKTSLPLKTSIAMDVVKYLKKGSFGKAAKRMLSLSTLCHQDEAEKNLTAIIAGEAGQLYALNSDLGTLQWCLENAEYLPERRLAIELDNVKSRVASLARILSKHPHIESAAEKDIEGALHAQTHQKCLEHVEALESLLAPIINESFKVRLEAAKLLPPPAWALPA
jgi:hypothetical protein